MRRRREWRPPPPGVRDWVKGHHTVMPVPRLPLVQTSPLGNSRMKVPRPLKLILTKEKSLRMSAMIGWRKSLKGREDSEKERKRWVRELRRSEALILLFPLHLHQPLRHLSPRLHPLHPRLQPLHPRLHPLHPLLRHLHPRLHHLRPRLHHLRPRLHHLSQRYPQGRTSCHLQCR